MPCLEGVVIMQIGISKKKVEMGIKRLWPKPFRIFILTPMIYDYNARGMVDPIIMIFMSSIEVLAFGH